MFPFEFQILLKVVGNNGKVHHLIGLFQSNGVYLPESHELDQRSEDGFYRTLALALHVGADSTVDTYFNSQNPSWSPSFSSFLKTHLRYPWRRP